MAGLISGPLFYAGSDMDLDDIPSTVAERGDPLGTLRQIGSATSRSIAEYGTSDEFGRQISPPEQMVDPRTLQKKWGIASDTPGDSLTFDSPLPESVAIDMNQAKHDEIMRKEAQARNPGGVGSALADFGYGMLDPVGIAASVLPVFGEARMGAALGRLGIDLGEGLAGRTALRAATGAVDATTANLPLVGLKYGLSQQDQADYSMSDAARDLAYGSVLGGVLHPALGALGDLLGRRAPAEGTLGQPAAPDPLAEANAEIPAMRALDADPRAGAAAMQAATAAVAEDRPVDVAPIANRAQQEADAIGGAYDQVRSQPIGPIDDPLVHITPDDIQGAIVARGGMKGLNDLETGGAHGLVKFIFKHGEGGLKDPADQITRDDLTAFPQVIRDFEPTRPGGATADEAGREWRVSLPGADGTPRTVVFADKLLRDGAETPHLVSAYVQEAGRAGHDAPLSTPRSGGPGSPGGSLEPSPGIRPRALRSADEGPTEGPGSPGEGSEPPQGYASERFGPTSEGQGPQDVARQPMPVNPEAVRRARGEPAPEDAATLRQADKAATAVTKAGAVDPAVEKATQAFQADIDRARAAGVLRAGDEAELQAATEAEQAAAARQKGILQAGACVARGRV